MTPEATLWPRDPHTEGKHLVLWEYLNAWLPILGTTQNRILFIDGFAGPGEYSGGEPGSPVVAMKAFVSHRAKRRITAEVVLVFIEKRADRANHLRSVVKKWKPKFPDNMRVIVFDKQEFDSTMKELLNDLKQSRHNLAPAFVMIDPFGVKGFSMEVIRGILLNPKCEVYVTIMWSSIVRFRDRPEFKNYMDDIFGSDWNTVDDVGSQDGRKALYGIYRQRLKDAGAKQVLSFDIYKDRKLIYSIFFATQSLIGCDKMKQAIWKIAPLGDFSFQGETNLGQIFIGLDPDYTPLRTALTNHFKNGWRQISDVLDFVKSDKTIFHSSQVKIKVLRPMEDEGLIEVKSRRRKGTYPDGCLIRFG